MSIMTFVQEWFSRDPNNVVAIHCKGGKGRTGMIICCLLLKMGIFTKPEDALEFFATRRTTTDKNEVRVKEQRVSSEWRGERMTRRPITEPLRVLLQLQLGVRNALPQERPNRWSDRSCGAARSL